MKGLSKGRYNETFTSEDAVDNGVGKECALSL